MPNIRTTGLLLVITYAAWFRTRCNIPRVSIPVACGTCACISCIAAAVPLGVGVEVPPEPLEALRPTPPPPVPLLTMLPALAASAVLLKLLESSLGTWILCPLSGTRLLISVARFAVLCLRSMMSAPFALFFIGGFWERFRSSSTSPSKSSLVRLPPRRRISLAT